MTIPPKPTELVSYPRTECTAATRVERGKDKVTCRSCKHTFEVERALRGGVVAKQEKGARR